MFCTPLPGLAPERTYIAAVYAVLFCLRSSIVVVKSLPPRVGAYIAGHQGVPVHPNWLGHHRVVLAVVTGMVDAQVDIDSACGSGDEACVCRGWFIAVGQGAELDAVRAVSTWVKGVIAIGVGRRTADGAAGVVGGHRYTIHAAIGHCPASREQAIIIVITENAPTNRRRCKVGDVLRRNHSLIFVSGFGHGRCDLVGIGIVLCQQSRGRHRLCRFFHH